MRFRRKVYGESYVQHCAFCASIATQQNEAGVYVCHRHRQERLQEVKCTCGSWLEQKSGKYGPYFHCYKCGNVPFKKGLELKELQESPPALAIKKSDLSIPEKRANFPEKKERKELTISTNDVEYFD